MAKWIVFLKTFHILNKLKDDFLNEIKLLFIFQDSYINQKNVLIVKNDDKVFAFGGNSNGVLGFGYSY